MLIRRPDAPDPWPLPEGPPAWLAWCLLIVGIGAAVMFVLAIGVIVARAAPPAGSDGKLAPWFRSLMQPGTGIGCCSEADCRQVEYRITGDHYEAFIKRGAGPAPLPARHRSVGNDPGGARVAARLKPHRAGRYVLAAEPRGSVLRGGFGGLVQTSPADSEHDCHNTAHDRSSDAYRQ